MTSSARGGAKPRWTPVKIVVSGDGAYDTPSPGSSSVNVSSPLTLIRRFVLECRTRSMRRPGVIVQEPASTRCCANAENASVVRRLSSTSTPLRASGVSPFACRRFCRSVWNRSPTSVSCGTPPRPKPTRARGSTPPWVYRRNRPSLPHVRLRFAIPPQAGSAESFGRCDELLDCRHQLRSNCEP